MDIRNYGEESVSVAIEKSNLRIGSRSLQPDIRNQWDNLYKKPDTTRKTCEFVANNRGLEE